MEVLMVMPDINIKDVAIIEVMIVDIIVVFVNKQLIGMS
jgi:hypothetical protein